MGLTRCPILVHSWFFQNPVSKSPDGETRCGRCSFWSSTVCPAAGILLPHTSTRTAVILGDLEKNVPKVPNVPRGWEKIFWWVWGRSRPEDQVYLMCTKCAFGYVSFNLACKPVNAPLITAAPSYIWAISSFSSSYGWSFSFRSASSPAAVLSSNGEKHRNLSTTLVTHNHTLADAWNICHFVFAFAQQQMVPVILHQPVSVHTQFTCNQATRRLCMWQVIG